MFVDANSEPVGARGGMEFGQSFVAARLDDVYAGNSTASLRQAPTSRIRDA